MFSNSCRYGIRAVIYIASQPKSGEKTGIKKIAEALELPPPFLAKILQILAKHKILYSAKGPHGGFSMQKDPKKVTLLDIIRIIDGDDFFQQCIVHNSLCQHIDRQKVPCPLHDDYEELRLKIIRLFENRTIYDLAKKAGDPKNIII